MPGRVGVVSVDHTPIGGSRRSNPATLWPADKGGIYVLDEPTSGQHLAEYICTRASIVARTSS